MVEQKSKTEKPTKRATHTSLTRGLKILEVIASSDGPAALSVTARKVGLPRSTTYHIMQTLTQLGYLRQDEDSRTYRLGEKAFQLSGQGMSINRIAETAIPLLKDLCVETGESAALAALVDGHVTLIATHDADGPVRVVQDVGAHRPVHATALGKVLAAWLPEAELSALLPSLRFESFTDKTVVQRNRFVKELQRVLSAGVAYDNEEFITGVRCVAAPVFNQGEDVVAALGLTGPRHRMPQQKMREFSPLVQRYATKLSDQLINGA
ncbi:MAG: IclR family transcriptional regulator [Pseudomonadota bacterium]